MSGPTFKLVIPKRWVEPILAAIRPFAKTERDLVASGKKTSYPGIIRLDDALAPFCRRASLASGRRLDAIETQLTPQLADDLWAFSNWIGNNARVPANTHLDLRTFIGDLRVELSEWLKLSIIDHIGALDS